MKHIAIQFLVKLVIFFLGRRREIEAHFMRKSGRCLSLEKKSPVEYEAKNQTKQKIMLYPDCPRQVQFLRSYHFSNIGRWLNERKIACMSQLHCLALASNKSSKPTCKFHLSPDSFEELGDSSNESTTHCCPGHI